MSNGENNKREDAAAEGVAIPQAEDSAAMTEAPAEEPKNPTESAEAPKSAAEAVIPFPTIAGTAMVAAIMASNCWNAKTSI